MDLKALKKAGIFAGSFLLIVLFYMFLSYFDNTVDAIYLNESYIESGDEIVLEQNILLEENFSHIGIYTGTYLRENNCVYEVAFYDGENKAHSLMLDATEFTDNEFYYFDISQLLKNVSYRMEIVGIGLSNTDRVAFMAGDKTENGVELIINGEESGKALKLSYRFSRNTLFIAILLLFITAAVFAICYLSLIGFDIAKLSFLAVLLFAVVFALINPVGLGNDEERHTAKAAVTADGKLFDIESMWEPIDWYYGAGSYEFEGATIADGVTHSQLEDREDISADSFGTAASYFSFSYLPQVIGITISRILSLFLPTTLALMYYPARIMNALAFALCVFFAVKNTKRYKLFILAFSMMFFNIFIAGSYSVDVVTNGMIILFISYIMKFCEGNIDRWDRVIVTGVFALLILTKVNYLPLALLLFIVPAELFSGKKDKYRFIASCVGISILLFGIWTALINMQYYRELQSGFGAQLKFMAENIVYTIRVFLRIPFNGIIDYFMRGFNPTASMNNSSFLPSSTITILYLLFIIEIARNYTSGLKFNVKNKAVVASVAFIIIMVTSFALYLYAPTDGIGADYVDGLQPRYFLPIIIMLPLFFKKGDEKNRESTSFAKIFVAASAFLMFSLTHTLYIFY